MDDYLSLASTPSASRNLMSVVLPYMAAMWRHVGSGPLLGPAGPRILSRASIKIFGPTKLTLDVCAFITAQEPRLSIASITAEKFPSRQATFTNSFSQSCAFPREEAEMGRLVVWPPSQTTTKMRKRRRRMQKMQASGALVRVDFIVKGVNDVVIVADCARCCCSF